MACRYIKIPTDVAAHHDPTAPDWLYRVFGAADWGNKGILSDEVLKDLIEEFNEVPPGNRDVKPTSLATPTMKDADGVTPSGRLGYSRISQVGFWAEGDASLRIGLDCLLQVVGW